jgi:hypothetical protein
MGAPDRAIDANSARASSSLIFGNLIEDRLPRLLLLVNERRGFGGRHRIRIAAERCKLPLQFRSRVTLRRSSLTLSMIASGVPMGGLASSQASRDPCVD